MAVFLLENEVGCDDDVVGFPSLSGCMAVVLQTDQALLGWHVYGSGRIDERVGAFVQFVQAMAAGTPVHLYGVCNHVERFGGDGTKWRAEMDAVATGINYNGPVSGFDLSDGTGIGHESTYAEFHRDGQARRCTIYYKRWSKMQSTRGDIPATVPQQRVSKRGNGYVLEGLYAKQGATPQGTTGATIVVTRSNKGRLHEASLGKIQSYTH